MPISQTELGRRVRAARESLGLTQEDAATALELARPAVAEIEAGRRVLSSLELFRLASLYGRDMKEFLAPVYSDEDALRAVFRAQRGFEVDSSLQRTLLDWRNRARALTDLEALLDYPRRLCTAGAYPTAPLSSRWNAIQQGELLAEEERGRLGLGRAPVGDLPMLLESQGIRTATVPLPDDVSGLTLQERGQDLLILVNRTHALTRHRFSFAHEYAHVLMDRERGSIVSRAEDRNDLVEMRANSFAAGFLMPTEGVLEFVRERGKGQGSRETAIVHDESDAEPVRVEGRSAPGSQMLQTYDVIQAADHFGVSCVAMIYRFKTVGLLKQPQVAALRAAEEARWATELQKLIGDGVSSPSADGPPAFQRRFIATALEAYRRSLISRGKLVELGALVELSDDQIETLRDTAAQIDEELDGVPSAT
ncbi:MAG TPA: XRE family transcriptional regulator [Gemmatimonadales bacterium]|jgi:Zn-dependent peptidase ImmA (M78 family)/DNA-binding XRE family transcriptional regulator